MTTPTRPRARQGFTLVEMLVVIVIIGILAGLITAAAFRARIAAKQAVIKLEVEQLAMAIEHYKSEVGEYPPDCVFLQTSGQTLTDARNDVLRHLRKLFPRYVPIGNNATDSDWKRFCDDVKNSYASIDPDKFEPGSALLFFLGGLPEKNTGEWIPAGFHVNPTNPFQIGGPRTKPYFEFARDRIKVTEPKPDNASVTRCLHYYPAGIAAPYVYFKARGKEYGTTDSKTAPKVVYPSYYEHKATNVCVPYLEPPTNEPDETKWRPDLPANQRLWRSLGKFQIISAGLDGEFGTGWGFRYTKAGRELDADGKNPTNLNAGNLDNLTNFAEGTLEDEM
jgi:general secretion pathway protein G